MSAVFTRSLTLEIVTLNNLLFSLFRIIPFNGGTFFILLFIDINELCLDELGA